MGKADKYNQMIQLMKGIHKMCSNWRGDCQRCPFHMDMCVFGEPMPKSWMFEDDDDEDEEVVVNAKEIDEVEAEIQAAPPVENAFVPLVREPVVDVSEIEEALEQPVEEKKAPVPEKVEKPKPVEPFKIEKAEKKAEKTEEVLPMDDSDGTWIVSTTMGSVLTKYVFICSKCGYKRESVFSIPPMKFCPECDKRKKQKA